MRWYEATLYGRVQTGVDETRNPVYELQETGKTILVRTAPAHAQRDATEGNAFDSVERSFFTKADRASLEGAVALMVRGTFYEIENLSAWDGPIVLAVKRCKPPWASS